jgi:hypothetical protein
VFIVIVKKTQKLELMNTKRKGAKKIKNFERNSLTLKLYSPLQNATKGVYLAKCGNILEY